MLLSSLPFPFASAALNSATRSERFHLSIRSDNTTRDGKAASACHQVALITSLCITDQAVNLTSPAHLHTKHTVTSGAGILEFNAQTPPTANATSNYSPMNFWFDAYTNIVVGFFQSLDVEDTIDRDRFTFIDEDLLVMKKAPIMDDGLAPNWKPAAVNETVDCWFVRETWAPAPDRRTNVVWSLGARRPLNPTCVMVDVVKVTG